MRRSLTKAIALSSLFAAAACASGQSPTEAGSMSPELVRAAALSGDAAVQAGETRAGADLYERAWRAEPSPSIGVRWGRALRLSGDLRSATVAMQEVARRFPEDVSVLTELGRSATRGGYRQEAGEAFAKAAASSAAGWETFMARGEYLARHGTEQEAEASFRRAEQLATSDRDRYSAQANLAALVAWRDRAAGLAMLEQVATRPDVHHQVHANLALIYNDLGDMVGYERHARLAMLSPETDRWLRTPSPLGGRGQRR